MSDTSPLFNLAAIEQLHLLREQFGEVLIPSAVYRELLPIRDRPEWGPIRQALDDGWIIQREVRNQSTVRALALDLGAGESEAIVLALEQIPATLLMDESDGRAAAARLGLTTIGVLGVLLRAKENGQIESIQEAMLALQEQAGFFISKEFFQQVLELAGESYRQEA